MESNKLSPFGETRADRRYLDTFTHLFANAALKSEFAERSIGIFASESRIEGCCAIDGGANHARHILTLVHCVGPTGKVIAYEPLQSNLEIITRQVDFHLRPRGLDIVVDLRQLAIGAANGDVRFTEILESSGYSGIHDAAPSHMTRVVRTAKCVRLDDNIFAEDRKRLRFIKLDLEGGDFDALRGAREILSEVRPVVVFENGRSSAANIYGYSRDEFFEYFASINYNIFCNVGLLFERADWEMNTALIPGDYLAIPIEQGNSLFQRSWPRQLELIEELQTDFP